jgi:uncharacterized protein involved in response to NO
MGVALILNLIPFVVLRPVTGVLLILASGLTLVRLLRWPVWHCVDRPDLIALMIGYLWLGLGWLLTGLALLTGLLPLPNALHSLTIGALGTLTLTVMARTRAQRVRKDSGLPKMLYIAVGLVSVAALTRLLAGTFLSGSIPYLLAAACWSLAFIILLGFLLYLGRQEVRLKSKDNRIR